MDKIGKILLFYVLARLSSRIKNKMLTTENITLSD